LIQHFDQLISLFYAYSRSETKIDEKEIEFKQNLETKQKEIDETKTLLA